MCYYAADKDALKKASSDILAIMGTGRDGLLEILSPTKNTAFFLKLQINVRKFLRQKRGDNFAFRETKNTENEKIAADYYLIEQIQPQGGITFNDERYIQTGNSYECCLHIYELPEKVNDNWLKELTDIKDTVVTIDISSHDIYEIKRTSIDPYKNKRADAEVLQIGKKLITQKKSK